MLFFLAHITRARSRRHPLQSNMCALTSRVRAIHTLSVAKGQNMPCTAVQFRRKIGNESYLGAPAPIGCKVPRPFYFVFLLLFRASAKKHLILSLSLLRSDTKVVAFTLRRRSLLPCTGGGASRKKILLRAPAACDPLYVIL